MGCLCAVKRAEAHMDVALKTLHKEVLNEKRPGCECGAICFSPYSRLVITTTVSTPGLSYDR